MPTAINGAIPHAAMHDDEFNGYKIPAGAGVVLAVWSANNDSDSFDDPRTFNPSRQNLNSTLYESSHNLDVKERAQWTFGSGRRMCPGMHVAENTLLLAIARILWTFEISPAKDPNGENIPIEVDAVQGGLAAAPAPFQ